MMDVEAFSSDRSVGISSTSVRRMGNASWTWHGGTSARRVGSGNVSKSR